MSDDFYEFNDKYGSQGVNLVRKNSTRGKKAMEAADDVEKRSKTGYKASSQKVKEGTAALIGASDAKIDAKMNKDFPFFKHTVKDNK